jgi:EAL domain-containing protein (putative c-di-GMP-specific phosphodiesterase class I)/DICT domain-containing protein
MVLAQETGIDGVFDRSSISSVYQPIVDLRHGDVVGVEALARWPALGISPDMAFAHARTVGRVAELDALCQRAAVDGLAVANLAPGFRVFVNVEPGSATEALTERRGGPELVAEVTERALLADPAELLRSLRTVRERGCGIALDDVGSAPESLALLPFVAPDVIKLDLSLVQKRPSADQARIMTAVAAYAERSGATVLAEGIETRAHYRSALTLGATLGQGWYFARPGRLVDHGPARAPISLLPAPPAAVGTPYGLVEPGRTRVGTKAMLLEISRHIEQRGMSLDTPPLLLSAFQSADRFTPATVERYRELAAHCALVVVLGAGLPSQPLPGVRGTDLLATDPLRGEWTVVLVGTHYAGALIARDLGDPGPDSTRRFSFALTHDHETVLAAARLLLGRVDPVRAVDAEHRLALGVV